MAQLHKKNFVELAKLLASFRITGERKELEDNLINFLQKTNERFDSEKFRNYITYWENKLSEKQELTTPASA